MRAGPPQTPFLVAEGRGNVGLLLSRAAKEANSVALHPFSKAKTNEAACFYLCFFCGEACNFQNSICSRPESGTKLQVKVCCLVLLRMGMTPCSC